MEKLLEKFIDKYLIMKNNMKNFIKILISMFLFGACDSNESILCAEYWVKLKKIPIQILCMESFDMTLTDLEKNGIDETEWLGILFQLCFSRDVIM